jgi:multiple sugar transport system permease protein
MTDRLEMLPAADPTAPAERHAVGRRARARGRQLAVLAFTGPALIWYVAFMIVPLGAMFYYSLDNWDSLIAPRTYAGFSNFSHMWSDPLFHAALRNTAIQLGVAVPLMLPMAFMLGFFLSRKPPGYRILSVIFFTPGLISTAARATMFVGVFQPFGILNSVLRSIGLGGLQHLWLASNSTALGTVIAVEVWGGIGWTAVLFAAALSAVPEEIYEAARLDGVNTWQLIWRIAYPLTRSFFGLMAMLQFIWLLTNAQDVLLLTNGGPGSSSMTLGFMLYDQAFNSGNLGYSQAIAVIVFAVGVLGMLLIRASFRDPVTQPQRRFRRR